MDPDESHIQALVKGIELKDGKAAAAPGVRRLRVEQVASSTQQAMQQVEAPPDIASLTTRAGGDGPFVRTWCQGHRSRRLRLPEGFPKPRCECIARTLHSVGRPERRLQRYNIRGRRRVQIADTPVRTFSE